MWVSGSDQVEHLAVELGVGAVHLQIDLLAEFADRSRTMRGSFCQALPIGCMRVLMTPSCSSAVTLERRCNHLELGVLVAARDLQQLVAGQHQLGDHGHQVPAYPRSTRIDWLAMRSPSPPVSSAADFFGAAFSLGAFSLAAGAGTSATGAGAAFAWRAPALRSRSRGRRAQIVERDLARTQRALQGLVDQGARGHLFAGAGAATGSSGTSGGEFEQGSSSTCRRIGCASRTWPPCPARPSLPACR